MRASVNPSALWRLLQRQIALHVAVTVVVLLEVIDIEKAKDEQALCSVGTLEFARKDLVEMTAVV
jgi:hypothetical protein